MITFWVHPVVPEHYQQGVVVQYVHNSPQNLVHLCQFGLHGIFFWSNSVPDVIDSKEMANQDIPLRAVRSMQIREEVLNDAVIYRMQIFDVERVVRVSMGKRVREEVDPGVVPHKYEFLICSDQLRDQGILFNRCRGKVGSGIHKSRQ